MSIKQLIIQSFSAPF